MLKKTILSSMILLPISSAVFAGEVQPYVGGSIGIGSYYHVAGYWSESATVFGGIGKLLDKNEKFYLGGELGASFSLHPELLGVSASIIPGLMLTKSTMLYGRIGLAYDYHPNDPHYYYSDTQFGLGVQTNVAKHWDVRAEYTAFGSDNDKFKMSLGLVYKFD